MRTTTVERSRKIANLLGESKPKVWNIEGLLGLLPKTNNVTWAFGYGGYDFKEHKDLDEYYVDFEIEDNGETEYKSFFNESMFDVAFEAVCWWLEREKGKTE